MAYKEKYPLDITPQGDTVQDSIKKNRDELLNVAQQMELKASGGGSGTGGGGAAGGGLRNRLLSGKVSNGEFSFLTGDNLSVMIDGSQTPVLLTFADGFDDYGAVDYLVSITKKQSAWSLPANSTSYLYVERSASGAISYGSTTLEPLRQPDAPNAETDKMYYNTVSEKMFLYTGTYWKSILRVVVAVAVTDATRVKSIKYYKPGVGGDFIADKSITTNKLADGAVQSNNIGNEQVKKEHLASDVKTLIEGVRSEINKLTPVINDVLKKVYPVGAIYCSTVATNPNSLFGFGTWEYIEQGRVLLSQGGNYAAGTTGGSATHTLTAEEMPRHDHYGSTGANGGHSHTGTASAAGEHSHSGKVYSSGAGRGDTDGASRYQDKVRRDDRFTLPAEINPSGQHSHSVSINSVGNHTHTIQNDGGGQAHSIMQPYLSVYMWKRVS